MVDNQLEMADRVERGRTAPAESSMNEVMSVLREAVRLIVYRNLRFSKLAASSWKHLCMLFVFPKRRPKLLLRSRFPVAIFAGT